MKVLLCTYEMPDYGLDLIFDGLCKNIGPENVYEYPVKSTLHGHVSDKFKDYPQYFNYEDKICSTGIHKLLESDFFDIIFIGCREKNTFRSYDTINTRDFTKRGMDIILSKKRKIPIVILDQDDFGGCNEEMLTTFSGSPYFKREYLSTVSYPERVIPLPFSYSEDFIPINHYSKNIPFFWAGAIWEKRKKFIDKISSFLNYPFDDKYRQCKYKNLLNRSEVCLNLRGAGRDCVRYWEIPAHGGLLFTERHGLVIENDFVDGESCLMFETPDECLDKLKYALRSRKFTEETSKKGREVLMKYHTSKERARFLLNKTKNYYGV